MTERRTVKGSAGTLQAHVDRRADSSAQESPSRARIDTLTDAELIEDLRTRGSDALDALLYRYRRLVLRVATNILRDAAEAEDVTQEVFLEVFAKAHQYDPSRGAVKVWLLQYAYHRSFRRKSSLRRRQEWQSEELDDRLSRRTMSLHELTPLERRWLLRTALAHLPTNQRATLELVCFEELDLREVAQRLHVSWGSARHYYYRGLSNLRSWFARGRASISKLEPPAARIG
jgi:RNA polymerase sigma-70 factor, ECF subfamily